LLHNAAGPSIPKAKSAKNKNAAVNIIMQAMIESLLRSNEVHRVKVSTQTAKLIMAKYRAGK
jgi:hypothetical protein